MLLLNILISSLFFFLGQTQESSFIRDYFLRKNVKNIVGFSCNDVDENSHFVKFMNKAGIKILVKGPGSMYNISRFLDCGSTRLGVFLDTRCAGHDTRKIFHESSIRRMYDYSYNWLILAKSLRFALKILNDSAFNFETDFVISTPNGEMLQLHDVYNPCKYRGGLINITMIGTWSKKYGFNITVEDPFPIRRRNFHGMRLNMGGLVAQRPSNISLPEYLIDENSKDRLDSRSKYGYFLLSHTFDIFNFTSNLTEYPVWNKNDTDGPEITNLIEMKIDFGFTPLIPTIQRFNLVQVILSAWPLRTAFFVRIMPSQELKMEKVCRPLAPESWIVATILTVIMSSVFSVILKIERLRKRDESDRYDDPYLVTFGSLCQQGVASCSKKFASRIAYLHILIFGILLYNYYSAAIVSARLHEPMRKLNDSLYSLIHTDLKLGGAKLLFFEYLLKDLRWDIQYFKKYWNRIPETKKFLDSEIGIQKVKYGNFAYHTDPDDAYPLVEKYFNDLEICQLAEVHLLRPIMNTFFTTKNQQFHEISKIGMLRVWSAGLQKRELTRWKSRKPYCNRNALAVDSITFYEVAPILALWFGGVLLCSLILIGELLISYATKIKFHLTIIRKESIRIKNHLITMKKES